MVSDTDRANIIREERARLLASVQHQVTLDNTARDLKILEHFTSQLTHLERMRDSLIDTDACNALDRCIDHARSSLASMGCSIIGRYGEYVDYDPACHHSIFLDPEGMVEVRKVGISRDGLTIKAVVAS